MPEKILDLLKNGSLTEWQIADALSLSVSEVTACIEYLQQMGFIRSENINPTGTTCSGNCGKCSSSCNGNSPSSYKVWKIV